ncbi:alpha/beta fold hydrolase [Pseudonocardia broussonetiae]|uniref:alpha/beta fold hydrolase n=1 Tax=Pseudonocardia broussonetiae TaxID=2736640 RepID=UPI001F045EAD|nr:alpha/beta fold hydrolase [Pseudonocardia broussonetiae]
MPRLPRVLLLALALLVLVPATALASPAPSSGPGSVTEARVDVPGATLDTTLYLPATTPAPAVLVAHGFGGSKASVDDDARALADRGFVVLAWSARGFGASTGQIALNAPDAEVADASALLDRLAAMPEVVQDGPGDPRAGVTGASYGGALALLLAGYDPRVDAIAPVITWNDLGQALFPNAAAAGALPADTPARGAFAADGVFKRGWAGVFFSAGLGTGAPGEPGTDDATRPAVPAAPAPGASPTCGRFTPEVCAAYTDAATTGRLSPATAALLERSSPRTVTGRITAPTLLVQGEQDTLFGLDQADANAREIAANGTPVQVRWYAGGHDGAAPADDVRTAVGDWFDHHLLGTGDDPGTTFSYGVESGLRAGSSTATGRTVVAAGYPGLAGAGAVPTQDLALTGGARVVATPAGGSPAAITALPGLGGALGSLGGRISALTAALPGQSAQYASAALADPLLLTGAPRIDLTVSRVPGQPGPDEAILFVSASEVTPDGTRTLLGGAVAPVRVAVPADGSPVTVPVTLPGVVAPVEAGNRVVVTVGTTDQAYAGGTDPAAWSVDAGTVLTVPVVPGEAVTANTVPLGPAVGIGVVLGVALLAWGAAALLRRRGAAAVDPAPDAPPLEIRDLAKTYRGGFSAVRGVSFRVERGQVLGLLGPNGAGKTTVLRMLMGLIRPTAGTMTAFGEPVGPGAPVLARIGAFVEGPGFLPHLSGADNLRLYWAATGRPTAEAHLDEALEIAGLGASVQRRVGAYSQGMRQRLAIAQAMLGLPELLVLDEPTNGLDPPQIHAMREVLRRYAAGGRTVLVSSHLLAEVEQTCDHVVVMHHGQVVADGSVEDVIAGGGAATFAVDAPSRAADVLGALAGVHAVEVDGEQVHAELNGTPRASAVRALVTAGVDVASAGPRRRLEDAFLQLVGEDGPS